MENSPDNGMIFSILAKKEGKTWIGHCLELDIVSTANTLEELKSDLEDLIVAQIDYAFSNDNLNHLYRPAPADVWKEFYDCREKIEDRIEVESSYPKSSSKTFVPPWIIAKMCLAEGSGSGKEFS